MQMVVEQKQPNYRCQAGKQAEFHCDRYSTFARLISAGTGAGKTRAGIQEAWLWTWECPGSVGLLLEPTYAMLKHIVIPAIEALLGCRIERHPAVSEYNRSDGRIVWANGTTWWMLGLNEPERVEGINADWAWPDEFRLVGGSGPAAKKKQEVAWNTIVRRLRGSVPGRYPTGIWVTTTPDEPGSLLHTKFERPDTKIPNSKVYRWTIFDNPFLPKHYIDEIKRSHVEGTGLYNRFVLGLFAAVAAGTFDFDSSFHVLKKMPAKDAMKEFIAGVDWGWSNPSAILAIGLDYDDRAYVYEEFYQNRATLDRIIRAGLDFLEKYEVNRFFCDRAEPRNIEALNDAGLSAVADATKRDDGIRELGTRFAKQPDGKARLYVHEDCVNLISELQVYDDTVKQYDHAVDALRYALANASNIGGNIEVGFGPRLTR